MKYKQLNATGIAIHSAATYADMDVDVHWIDHEHRKRGFDGIGYHWFIKRDGTIQEGRSMNRMGAHVRGHNHYTIAICMAGGLGANKKAENNFTTAQWGSLAELVATLLRDNTNLEFVIGHRDFPGTSTACPSFDAMSWVESHTLLINLLERNHESNQNRPDP